jgi:hypothetical protein
MTPEKQNKAAWHELEKLLKEDALKKKNAAKSYFMEVLS